MGIIRREKTVWSTSHRNDEVRYNRILDENCSLLPFRVDFQSWSRPLLEDPRCTSSAYCLQHFLTQRYLCRKKCDYVHFRDKGLRFKPGI
jgi:hypothetical protein